MYPIHGNGWRFLPELEAAGWSLDTLKSHVRCIVSANNLAMIIPSVSDEYAFSLIQNFFDQAKDVLETDGEIVLIHDTSALRVRLFQPEWSEHPMFIIPDGGYIDNENPLNRNQAEQIYFNSRIWGRWIYVLKNRPDAAIPIGLAPIQT